MRTLELTRDEAELLVDLIEHQHPQEVDLRLAGVAAELRELFGMIPLNHPEANPAMAAIIEGRKRLATAGITRSPGYQRFKLSSEFKDDEDTFYILEAELDIRMPARGEIIEIDYDDNEQTLIQIRVTQAVRLTTKSPPSRISVTGDVCGRF